MRPTIQLINALRSAADTIEAVPHDIGGYWHQQPDACNCGWLARCLGVDRNELKHFAYYSDAAEFYFQEATDQSYYQICSVTGQRVSAVMRQLELAGLESYDFRDIEFLQNDAVLTRARLPKFQPNMQKGYDEPRIVARYFRAQADILEEQLAEQFERRELKPISPVSPPAKQVSATDGLAHGSGTACQLAERQA